MTGLPAEKSDSLEYFCLLKLKTPFNSAGWQRLYVFNSSSLIVYFDYES